MKILTCKHSAENQAVASLLPATESDKGYYLTATSVPVGVLYLTRARTHTTQFKTTQNV